MSNFERITYITLFPGPRLCLPSVLLTAARSTQSYPTPSYSVIGSILKYERKGGQHGQNIASPLHNNSPWATTHPGSTSRTAKKKKQVSTYSNRRAVSRAHAPGTPASLSRVKYSWGMTAPSWPPAAIAAISSSPGVYKPSGAPGKFGNPALGFRVTGFAGDLSLFSTACPGMRTESAGA